MQKKTKGSRERGGERGASLAQADANADEDVGRFSWVRKEMLQRPRCERGVQAYSLGTGVESQDCEYLFLSWGLAQVGIDPGQISVLFGR